MHKYRPINEVLKKFVSGPRLARIDEVLSCRKTNLKVVFDRVSDPFNISACYRTCDLFGIQYVDMIVNPELKPTTADAKKRKLVSKSAECWISPTEYSDVNTCVKNLKDNGFQIWATDLAPGAIPIGDIGLVGKTNGKDIKHLIGEDQKVALVFGNELKGISQEIRDVADIRYYLPMFGFVQSFNIGVSVALSLYHLKNVMGFLKEKGNLTELEVERLKAQYLAKNCFNAEMGNSARLVGLLRDKGVEISPEVLEEIFG